MGRPWLVYWLAPVSRTRWRVWPNFRSPLLWDVFAVSTYVTVSLLFWYVGHDPRPGDAPRPGRRRAAPALVYGLFALGWRGSARQWHRYERAYLLLAGAGHAAGAVASTRS